MQACKFLRVNVALLSTSASSGLLIRGGWKLSDWGCGFLRFGDSQCDCFGWWRGAYS